MAQNVECTIYSTLDIVGKKWSLQIILALHKGKMRFNEIKSSTGATSKMLSIRLGELEKDGIIKKKIDSRSMPIKCTYSLTESGKDLVKVISAIKTWGKRWKFDFKYCNDCKKCKA